MYVIKFEDMTNMPTDNAETVIGIICASTGPGPPWKCPIPSKGGNPENDGIATTEPPHSRQRRGVEGATRPAAAAQRGSEEEQEEHRSTNVY